MRSSSLLCFIPWHTHPNTLLWIFSGSKPYYNISVLPVLPGDLNAVASRSEVPENHKSLWSNQLVLMVMLCNLGCCHSPCCAASLLKVTHLSFWPLSQPSSTAESIMSLLLRYFYSVWHFSENPPAFPVAKVLTFTPELLSHASTLSPPALLQR